MEEVEKHTGEDSVWFVHEGKVYDGTPFLADHPGGAESILIIGGQDATEDFNAIHSAKVGQGQGVADAYYSATRHILGRGSSQVPGTCKVSLEQTSTRIILLAAGQSPQPSLGGPLTVAGRELLAAAHHSGTPL